MEMDIYAQKGSAIPQKSVVLTIELLLVALSAWILFGSGREAVASLFGWQPAPQIPSRAYLIFAFSLVTLARNSFKKNLANGGKLYVSGLFSLSRHVNFFGDILWVSAYAIVAHTVGAAIIPMYTLCFFGFFNAPALDRHLADHYGEQYTAYAVQTKMLIPFVW